METYLLRYIADCMIEPSDGISPTHIISSYSFGPNTHLIVEFEDLSLARYRVLNSGERFGDGLARKYMVARAPMTLAAATLYQSKRMKERNARYAKDRDVSKACENPQRDAGAEGLSHDICGGR